MSLKSPGVLEPGRERPRFGNVGGSWVSGMDGIDRSDWKRSNLYARADVALSTLIWTRDGASPARVWLAPRFRSTLATASQHNQYFGR
jgi:hypothetical protein